MEIFCTQKFPNLWYSLHVSMFIPVSLFVIWQGKFGWTNFIRFNVFSSELGTNFSWTLVVTLQTQHNNSVSDRQTHTHTHIVSTTIPQNISFSCETLSHNFHTLPHDTCEQQVPGPHLVCTALQESHTVSVFPLVAVNVSTTI